MIEYATPTRVMEKTAKKKTHSPEWFIYLSLAIVCVISMFPVLWMIAISVKPVTESVSGWQAFRWSMPTFENVASIFSRLPVLQNTYNSLFSTIIGTGTALFFSSLAGFAFAKYRFPGRNVLFYIVVATLFVPMEVGIIPLFVIMRHLGLVNSLWALIIPKAAPAIGIFYMTQYIKSTVPDAIIEAARMDGCSDFGTYWRIILPIIRPGMAAWGTITIIARWNDFFWPLIILRTQEKFTLVLSIALLPVSEGLSTPWPVVMAGTCLAVIPVIILYFILQRYHISGITSGVLKG